MGDPHDDLGVRRGASDEEIKAAYRRLAQIHHPDKQSTPASRAEAKFAFNRITAARNALLASGALRGPPDGGFAASSSAWTAAAHRAPTPPRHARLSNLSFAVVLAFPLCLIGVVSHWAFPSVAVHGPAHSSAGGGRRGGGAGASEVGSRAFESAGGEIGGETMGRINGWLEPPVNPWLRDDVAHAGRRKGHDRPPVSTRVARRAMGMLGIEPVETRRARANGSVGSGVPGAS